MGTYIEPVILYFVLFFSGTAGTFVSTGEAAGFSAAAELARIFLYSIPSLALILYMIIKSKSIWVWIFRPGKKDFISCMITFPCLLITGFSITLISLYIGGNSAQISIYSPATLTGWIILSFSCICTGYLEESFFRFYLLTRREDIKPGTMPAVFISIALFSISHIYEGPWGFLNSVISAIIITFIFLRYQSIHGISIAHGLYNITIYAINALMTQSS